ncbi:UDP-glucuronate 4-epimerase 3 [Hibiscus syriacus]|uniref:UDP-glucuronate 4-epimerase 3 n=1 Tax=Hibiscus syriacus TaxID=106335 RepID=A0A6A2Y6I7_HIBSY|nr:UDP-glucuronate 4-epimerase 3 [Hibiscus syriacus]
MNRQFQRCFASTSTMFLWALFLIALTASYLSFQSFVESGNRYFTASWGGIQLEKQIRNSAQIQRPGGMSVLVTGAAGFVGSHVSLALKKRGDGVVGLDNFNNYYDPSLKKARQSMLDTQGILVVEGDLNDAGLLAKLFDVVAFTHVLHLAAQAGVRPDMAYFSFTRNILQGKTITVYRGKNKADLARDFTYIDDIVKGCLGSLDTSGKSTGSSGKKWAPAPYRNFNLGNTSPVKVPTLVSILEKHLKLKAKKKTVDMPGNGDVPFTHANISLARRQLGYKPTTDLQTGLKNFVRCFSFAKFGNPFPQTDCLDDAFSFLISSQTCFTVLHLQRMCSIDSLSA